tara:strand:- start:1168 stop:2025 length:858 start_codon:yes stop_codon:yes gene_type:complete
MKIIDSFMFYNEFELALIRFMELYEKVDQFVIVEAKQKHLGGEREPIFWQNKNFKQFKNKIDYHQVDLVANDGWGKENEHRVQVGKALKNSAQPEDLIIFSDCDEIPNIDTILNNNFFIRVNRVIALNQMFFLHRNNLFSNKCVTGSICVMGDLLLEKGDFFVQELRNAKDYLLRLENGGWHYSYFGDDAKKLKLKGESIAEGSKTGEGEEKNVLSSWKKIIHEAVNELKSPFSQEKLRFLNFSEENKGEIDFITAKKGEWINDRSFFDFCPQSLTRYEESRDEN